MRGHFQVKGSSVTESYYQNPARNREVFSDDGWFNTGDIGYLQDGHLILTGRDKDDIIINGFNFYSPEKDQDFLKALIQKIRGHVVQKVGVSPNYLIQGRAPKNVLTQDLLAKIRQYKSDLITLLQGSVETYPLSHGQSALWFLYQLAPESAAIIAKFYSTISFANNLATNLLTVQHGVIATW